MATKKLWSTWCKVRDKSCTLAVRLSDKDSKDEYWQATCSLVPVTSECYNYARDVCSNGLPACVGSVKTNAPTGMSIGDIIFMILLACVAVAGAGYGLNYYMKSKKEKRRLQLVY
jgi:hypothetical protein